MWTHTGGRGRRLLYGRAYTAVLNRGLPRVCEIIPALAWHEPSLPVATLLGCVVPAAGVGNIVDHVSLVMGWHEM